MIYVCHIKLFDIVYQKHINRILTSFLKKSLLISKNHIIFALVFHRILDFKAGLDFYLGPFFYVSTFRIAILTKALLK
jgi:hypothetical protein